MASKTLNSIKRKCEHISSYESGLDDGLKDDLKFIISKTEALIRELKGKGAEEALVALASDFKRGVSQDLEDLISFKRLNKKLRDALENVEKLEIRRRKAEERAFSICREY
ncbi:MAG: hypothetical protein ACE5NL_00410, partial [Candidatus Hydrothermarchaeaceae archaeon]